MRFALVEKIGGTDVNIVLMLVHKYSDDYLFDMRPIFTSKSPPQEFTLPHATTIN